MAESHSPGARTLERNLCLALFVITLAVSFWFARGGWNNAVLDTHPFRQTQTAMSAYWMVQDGFRLDYETPLMGPPWSLPLEFPIYEGLVAKLSKTAHLPLDQAGRTVSLVFFYLSLPAVWLLLRRFGVSAGQSWLFLALVLTCPVYQMYSRSFLIESTAFCLAAWFLYFFHAGVIGARNLALAGAVVFGVAVGLAKVTTYAVFLAPATAIAIAQIWRRREALRLIVVRGVIAVVPGLIVAVWWIRYSDAIKERNILGSILTSAKLHEWNYGTPGMRFTADFWSHFGGQVERSVLPPFTLFLGGALALLFLRGRVRLFLLLLAIALAGPLVFTNLYYVHDYYLFANGVFFLLLLALPLQRVFENPSFPLAARLGVVILALAAQIAGYLEIYREPQTRAKGGPPDLALAMERATNPDDIILGLGMNWDATMPYYSHRRAMMIADDWIKDDATIHKALKNLEPAHPTLALVRRGGDFGPEHFASLLTELNMDAQPLFQTGEYAVFIRKERLPDALKALKDFRLGEVYLYNGQLAPAGDQPHVMYWVDQLPNRAQLFEHVSPQPIKMTVPFGISIEMIDKNLVLNAHATTEIEIVPPAGARHIRAEFGLNPAGYDKSDGVLVEVVAAQDNGYRQILYSRLIQPATIAQDRGIQVVSVDTLTPIQGHVLFRTSPGPSNSANFDWTYWKSIKVE